MKTFNKTRTILTIVLTILLIASLLGTWVVASAFSTNSITSRYTLIYDDYLTTGDADTLTTQQANNYIGYDVGNTVYMAVNGQIYANSHVASSFTVNQLLIAGLGVTGEDDEGYWTESFLVFRNVAESQWYMIDNQTSFVAGTYYTQVLDIAEAGTYIFFTVFEDSDGAEERSAYLTVTVDPTLGQVTPPEKYGKVFTGWYTDADCTIPYTGQVITGDVVLYAGYRPVEFDIVFNANGGTGTMASEHVVFDRFNPVSMSTSFTRPGYNFVGWRDASGYEYIPDGDYDVYYNLYEDGSSNTLYAIWEEADFLVSFNANGGTTPTSNKTVTYNSTYGTLPTPTRTGYTFAGWFTSASGGTQVTSSSPVSITSAQTLFAHWTANSYKVTFDANGGTTTTTEKNVTYDSTYGTLPSPTRTGYTFAGWYTAKTGGSKVETSTQVKTASAHTLYARWTANTYKVTFDANGGTTTTTEKNVTYDSTYGTLPSPTRTGYTFAGWYTAKTGGSKVESTTKVAITSAQTLYARWTANSYKVTFDANGGTTSTASKNVTYASTYGTLPTPTYTGKVFLGWFTAKSGGTQVTSSSTVSITSAQTLYAHWRSVKFTVEFDANGGTGTMADMEIVYDGANTVPSCTFTRTGYTFSHWVDHNGYMYVEDTSSGANDLVFNLYNDGSTIVLQAVWTANSYYVKFNGNGSTSGSMNNQPHTYDASKALTANAFARAYVVTYNYNGNGTANTTATATATFNGWATSASGAKVYSDKQSVTNLATEEGAYVNLYANWTLGTVTLPTPTRTGYTFQGWFTSATGGTKVGAGGASYTPSGAVTLYAQWSANSFTVKYNANTGTGSMSDQGFVYDVAEALTANAFTKTGYTFVGWNTKANGTGTSYTNKQSVTNIAGSNTSVTLYAQWTANKFTVKFDINCEGGEGTMSSQSFTYDASKALTTNAFVREGHTFLGWSTSKTATAPEYLDSQSVKNLTTTNNDSVTLYAVWKINRHSVTFIDSETGETIAVVVVDWGTPVNQVIASAVNTALYEPDDPQRLPNLSRPTSRYAYVGLKLAKR